jgi:anaerobic ribonucleoside-triphosphate reductase activating protein
MLLPYLDVLVDGPFILEQRDTDLLFRGSPNQRIIYLHGEPPKDDIPGTVALQPLR